MKKDSSGHRREDEAKKTRVINLAVRAALTVLVLCKLGDAFAATSPSTPSSSGHSVLTKGGYFLHPGFELTLFAREPDVVDPVALTFDERGRMYVVEMRDYPTGVGSGGGANGAREKSGGTIRLLEDQDGDGRADRSVIFAEGLSFPTSIAPWAGGVIVTASPEIMFLKDADGDGHAEIREVLFSGFRLGVTDSNVNGLRWGLDNRLHGVNGGNGGTITSHRRAGQTISIRGLDFSFDPGAGDFVPTAHTSGGFGLVFDDWGHSFVTYNINHLQQRIIPVRYLRRFPGLPPVEAVASISDHEEMSRIFPVSDPAPRPNHPEQSGRFSAAGGIGFGGVRGWPGDVSGSVFVCDVVGNLIHRDVLVEDGPIFRAVRSPVERTNEFFAARDPALRPVGLELGPDGALYLIDMQRDVIEHPDYIPKKTLAGLDLRAGSDRGRIYRVTPRGVPRLDPSVRGEISSVELVRRLGDRNQWWRGTAQRVLVERRERGDSRVIGALRSRAMATNALGRLHALWTLQGLQALDEELVLAALDDSQPGIRESALILAEPFLSRSRRIMETVIARADDASARVRFQAALTLGQIESDAAEAGLARVFQRDAASRWTRLAVLSSLRRGEGDWLVRWLRSSATNAVQISANGIEPARELAELCGARAGGTVGLEPILAALAGSEVVPTLRRAVLEGLSEGLRRAPRRGRVDGAVSNALVQLLNDPSPSVLAAAWRLANRLRLPESGAQRAALERSIRGAADPSTPLLERVEQVQLLALGKYGDVGEILLQRLAASEPPEIQTAALTALRRFNEISLASRLVDQWRSLAPALRGPVLGLLLQRTAFHAPFVDALETGRLTLGELNLDLEQRRRLLRRSSPEIMARSSRLIGDEEYSHRRGLVSEWLSRLPATGNSAAGRPVFDRLCAQCHALGGDSFSVGPNLAAVAHRSVEDLVSNILDPNMAINPAYVNYSAETHDGELHTGVLQSESAEAVILGQAMGSRVTLRRSDLRSLGATGLSLMPEGLESGLTPTELRDLVAYLQVPR